MHIVAQISVISYQVHENHCFFLQVIPVLNQASSDFTGLLTTEMPRLASEYLQDSTQYQERYEQSGRHVLMTTSNRILEPFNERLHLTPLAATAEDQAKNPMNNFSTHSNPVGHRTVKQCLVMRNPVCQLCYAALSMHKRPYPAAARV